MEEKNDTNAPSSTAPSSSDDNRALPADALRSSQTPNAQLRHLLAEQVTLARQMQQLVSRQVNRDLAFWICHDKRMKEIRFRARVARPCDHLQRHHEREPRERNGEENGVLGPVDEAQVFMMLQRVDFLFQQIDLVFQQHVASSWQTGHLATQPFNQVRLRCALPKDVSTRSGSCRYNDGKFVNKHMDFAELVGCAVTQFDADTLLELIWKCFASRDTERSICYGRGGTDVPLPSKMHGIPTTSQEQNDFWYHQLHAAMKDDSIPPVCEEFHDTVTDNVIHLNRHYEILLPQETHLGIDVNGALKRFSNAIVINYAGKAAVSSCPMPLKQHQQRQRLVEFSRSVWLQVEAREDGTSMLRHVYRMWPVTMTVEPMARESVVDYQKLHRQELQLMGQLLRRVHSEMSYRFERLVRERFGEAHAKRNSMWSEGIDKRRLQMPRL